MSSTALLEIELLDINDNSPEADDVIEREIPRSSKINHVIVSQINATDRDSGRNALLTFGNNYFLCTTIIKLAKFFSLVPIHIHVGFIKLLITLCTNRWFVVFFKEFTTNNSNDDRYTYFKMNATNGEISIAKNLTTLQLDSVALTVNVSDNGLPQRLSTSVMVC